MEGREPKLPSYRELRVHLAHWPLLRGRQRREGSRPSQSRQRARERRICPRSQDYRARMTAFFPRPFPSVHDLITACNARPVHLNCKYLTDEPKSRSKAVPRHGTFVPCDTSQQSSFTAGSFGRVLFAQM